MQTTMKIPLLDLRAQYAQIQHEIEAAVLQTLRHTQYILGPEVSQLEHDLQAFTGAKHIITCASGSDALLLALMALDLKAGDEIITSPYTFFATGGSIARLGLRPVFVDIDADTYNLDPNLIAAKIGRRTKAILPVHLFGQCAQMQPILDTAAAHNLAVIEDAAQAIGATYRAKQAGTMGTMGCFSFFPSKNLGAAGDGGAIATNDEALAEKLRLLRVHGSKPKYHHQCIGVNSRLDTIQAAILRVKLKHLNEWSECRRKNADRYTAQFKSLGVEHLVHPPVRHPDCGHIYNQYVIRIARRDALRAHLQQQGIGTEIYYPVPLHLQKCFEYLGHGAGDFPHAERAARESLALPIYPELTSGQIDYVAETVADFVKS
jgi:dTDP-4-amino-4,6-dideoxygalactose transaminase